MFLLAFRLERADEALEWARHGEAALERGRLPQRARAEFLHALAVALHRAGRFDDAKARIHEATEIRRTLEGDNQYGLSFDYAVLSSVLLGLGDLDRAVEAAERSKEARLAAVGPDHPEYALSIYTLAIAHAEVGRTDDGERLLEEALALRRRLLPADHPDVAGRAGLTGDVGRAQAGLRQGQGALRGGVRPRQGHPGGPAPHRVERPGRVRAPPRPVRRGPRRVPPGRRRSQGRGGAPWRRPTPRPTWANVYLDQKRYDEALGAFVRAYELAVGFYGEAHPMVTQYKAHEAWTHMLAGNIEKGEAIYQSVLARLEALGDGARIRTHKLNGARFRYTSNPEEGRREVQKLRTEAEAAGGDPQRRPGRRGAGRPRVIGFPRAGVVVYVPVARFVGGVS